LRVRKMLISSTQGNKRSPLYQSILFDLSFGMILFSKVDLTILGAMEVAENGDIANWKMVKW
jgi:acyl CoA:acetate/3-ketoacid CoA transferase beta subunit